MKMYKNRHILILLLGLLINLSVALAETAQDALSHGEMSRLTVPVYIQHSTKDYDDVIQDLLIAIGEHNFLLNQHAKIGQAIAKRDQVEMPRATILHFCNLSYARTLLETAPDSLLRMPCRIAIREISPQKSRIEVWLLPENDKRTQAFAKKINHILKEIVDFGAN